MNVEHQESVEFGETKADIHIPSKYFFNLQMNENSHFNSLYRNVVIQIVTGKDLTLDHYHLKGPAILRKRILEAAAKGNTVVLFNSPEFTRLVDHMSKINYLVSLGIN